MRGALDFGLPGDRDRENQRMQREHLEQREHAVLVQQQKADQDQPAGQQVRDIELQIGVGHYRTWVTNISRVASRASISAAPRKTGTRKTRILAMLVSKMASRYPATASLAR